MNKVYAVKHSQRTFVGTHYPSIWKKTNFSYNQRILTLL
jgi:hypothetical protein